MAISFSSNFKYSITKNGKSVLDEDTILAYFFVKETVNKIPELELVLMSKSMSEYFNNSDIEVSLYSKDMQYKYDMGVYNYNIEGGSHSYYGYGCKVSDFQEVGSAYLGEDLESAITALGIKTNVEGVDKITGGYWQINETKLNALYRLIKGVKENSVTVINNDSIKVIDYSENCTKENDFICPTKIEYATFNDYFDTNGLGSYKIYDSNNMYNASWRDKSYVGYDHKDFAVNLTSSIKNTFYNKMLIKMEYKNKYVPYEVGSCMNVELPFIKLGPMRIVSKSTKFTLTKTTTTLILESGEAYDKKG